MRRLLLLALILPIPANAQEAELRRRIRLLGHRDYRLRVQAQAWLETRGAPVAPLLRQAAKHPDAEVRRRARQILGRINTRQCGPAPPLIHRVSVGCETARDPSLVWLKGQLRNGQRRAGHWRDAEPWAATGTTGLALLAYVGYGNSHRFGPYKDICKRTLRYLIRLQDAQGGLTGRGGDPIYNHVLATLALTESFRMTKSPIIKGAAGKAITYLIGAQGRRSGTWQHTRREGGSDIDLTPWCLLALSSARRAELRVPGLAEATRRALKAARGLRPHHSDALGLATRLLALGQSGKSRRDPAVRRLAEQLVRLRFARLSAHEAFVAATAMQYAPADVRKRWNAGVRILIKMQRTRPGSPLRGSWDPTGRAGHAAGRVYTTALRSLTLQVHYRYRNTLR